MKKETNKDIWIGEFVKIKSSGREGRFEGLNSEGKARVSDKGKIYVTTMSNLEVLPPQEYKLDLSDIIPRRPSQQKSVKINFEHTLDLHIEKLAPHLIHNIPQYILDYQLAKSRSFIDNAIEYNYPHITIIHGKGQGILKAAIENLLKSYAHIKFTFSKNDGGAVEIWM